MGAHRALDLHRVDVTRKQQLYLSARILEHSGKNGKMLAYLSRTEYVDRTIPRIQLPDGSVASDPIAINQAFKSFYESLYAAPPPPDEEETLGFLESLRFPVLEESHVLILDKPLTVEEVTEAIYSLPPNRAPGLDGLPAELYKNYAEELAQKLHSLFGQALQEGELPSSMCEALIVVLPKPDKDKLLCGSYRPISLLNSDVKVLAKVLALRLQKVILHLIHRDQAGFMPGRSTYDNIRRLYLHIHRAEARKKGGLVLSLDVLKAFDTVNWSFLWEAMHRMGFSARFIRWVRLLYTNPRARVSTNKDVSDVFTFQRGTRQGCPLSPLLFALAIEPLALAVRQTAEVAGICCGSLSEKISLYAADALIYLDGSEP